MSSRTLSLTVCDESVVWLTVSASRRMLLMLHFTGLLVPSTLFISLVYYTLLFFVPVMGRTGTASHPDLFIGCLTVSAVIVLLAWQVTGYVHTHTYSGPLSHGLQGCKNRPAPFPGRMLYKATKPRLCLSCLLA